MYIALYQDELPFTVPLMSAALYHGMPHYICCTTHVRSSLPWNAAFLSVPLMSEALYRGMLRYFCCTTHVRSSLPRNAALHLLCHSCLQLSTAECRVTFAVPFMSSTLYRGMPHYICCTTHVRSSLPRNAALHFAVWEHQPLGHMQQTEDYLDALGIKQTPNPLL
jgi:hypothetical protein